jgi:hypothetical protein
MPAIMNPYRNRAEFAVHHRIYLTNKRDCGINQLSKFVNLNLEKCALTGYGSVGFKAWSRMHDRITPLPLSFENQRKFSVVSGIGGCARPRAILGYCITL